MHVLIANEDPKMLIRMWQALRAARMDVAVERRGRDALDAVRTTPFDVVVTGTRFTGLEGSLWCEMRRDGIDTPVLVVAGRVARASVPSYVGCLETPFGDADLVAAIRAIVNDGPDT